jgi:signal transduction histidine kinase
MRKRLLTTAKYSLTALIPPVILTGAGILALWLSGAKHFTFFMALLAITGFLVALFSYLVRRQAARHEAMAWKRSAAAEDIEFVLIMAHQLRTPLSGIKWTFNMLLKGELGPLTIDQREFMLKAQESNEKMIALIEDMLYANRMSAGKSPLESLGIPVWKAILDVVDELKPKVAERGVSIALVGTEKPLPDVHADKDKIRMLLQNLIENAIKYTPRGGSVTICAEPGNGEVKVSVRDTGIGVPESEKKSIFGKFYRAKNALHMESHGTGLGLFIAKQIVDQHGGKIWFESEEGKGSTFYFTLKT